MKSKSVILMVLSLGFGLVAAIGISQLMKVKNANASAGQATPMGPVLLAAKSFDPREEITEEKVRLENWPVTMIPEGACTTLEDIKDMATPARLSPGVPIIKESIVHKSDSGKINVPPGFKVVTIKVSAEDNFAGLLNPGDRVDVIGLFKRRKKDGSQQTLSRTFLKALQVFSINNRLAAATDRQEGAAASGAIVGVLVNEKQAEEIFFVQRTGTIKLVLRGEYDEQDENVESLSDIMELEDEAELAAEEAKLDREAKQFPQQRNVPRSMVVWKAGSPTKVIFSGDDLPQTMGGNAPAGFGPPPESKMDDMADEDDFNGREEINRRIEEDQYPSE